MEKTNLLAKKELQKISEGRDDADDAEAQEERSVLDNGDSVRRSLRQTKRPGA